MNGKDIFLGLGQVSEKYIDEAEFGVFHPEKREIPKQKKVLPLRKTLLVAAIVVLTLVLAGCTVAYVLHLQDLHMGSRDVWVDNWDENLEYQGRETVTEQVFSLGGLKGTPAYQGTLAWFDFIQSYDPDYAIADSLGADRPVFPGKYDAYGIYTQEMADKLDEITQTYGLELLGPTVEGMSGKSLFRYFGVENLLSADSTASMDTLNAWAYESGGLYSDFFLRLPEETGWPYDTLCSYHLNPKNALCIDTFTQSEDSTWREWNYTTQSGDKVLILRDADVNISWILCNREDAMVSVRIQSEHSVGTDEGGVQQFTNTPMTDRQLEQAADAINWELALKPGDPALLEGSAGDSSQTVQIQNGVAVKLKKVETDGLTAYITLGVTAPEGTKLTRDTDTRTHLWFDTARLSSPESMQSIGVSLTGGAKEDGDGKDNTIDIVLTAETYAESDGDSFCPGDMWQLYLEDVQLKTWNHERMQEEILWEVSGAWKFDIPISESNNFRELEFVKDPITTSLCTGWHADGTDVFENATLYSLKLRTFSARFSAKGPYEGAGLDFTDARNDKFPYVVLKDGTTINLWLTSGNGTNFDPIPVDEVAYLMLIDGTKLTPVS